MAQRGPTARVNGVPDPEHTTHAPVVDPDHPWLGLYPFTEENQLYFFGRGAEIRDLFLRVRENALTVLYGQSGLGKTSLLRAGLLPKLRAGRFRPVYVRLDFAAGAPAYATQVRAALARACAASDSEAAALLERWAPLGSLWEIYTHETLRPDDLADSPPVLVFDQFEEVFTLGEEGSPSASDRAALAELFGQLADLVENRAPEALQRQFQSNPERAAAYDFGPSPARIVLALREDYLAQLEQWKPTLPSLMRNRMPLRLLSGPQALEAVVRPGRMEGRDLVSDEVGAQIVRFVAQRPEGTPLEDIEAVPPLVSLLCERLNAARFSAPSVAGSDLRRPRRRAGRRHPAALLRGELRRLPRSGPRVRRGPHGHRRRPPQPGGAGGRRQRAGEARRAGPERGPRHLVGRRLLTAEQRGGTPARGDHARRPGAAGGQRARHCGASARRRRGSRPSGRAGGAGAGSSPAAADARAWRMAGIAVLARGWRCGGRGMRTSGPDRAEQGVRAVARQLAAQALV